MLSPYRLYKSNANCFPFMSISTISLLSSLLLWIAINKQHCKLSTTSQQQPEQDMAASYLRRRLSRTSQYVSETLDQSRSTWLGSEFFELRQKMNVYNRFVIKMRNSLKDCLRPNPLTKMKGTLKSSYCKYVYRGYQS